ncbi:hypothetical protein BDA99DRAFT_508405 [Phascolomyces articulosus]|uniref:Polyketide synthase n=1 Tax=Phascolomyces articulosus TaxID=60185 RepID=A0AAD5KAA0_9FUNG|nr:hypothetical protein BDA99DRAFT_508405 [Phascolomyces articulosus]
MVSLSENLGVCNDSRILYIDRQFDVSFESMGQNVQVGSSVPKEAVGTFALISQYGTCAEYLTAPFKSLIPIPGSKIDYPALLSAGLTASIALEQAGRMTTGEAVLVTAAANDAGQMAVQLAKLAGNHLLVLILVMKM